MFRVGISLSASEADDRFYFSCISDKDFCCFILNVAEKSCLKPLNSELGLDEKGVVRALIIKGVVHHHVFSSFSREKTYVTSCFHTLSNETFQKRNLLLHTAFHYHPSIGSV